MFCAAHAHKGKQGENSSVRHSVSVVCYAEVDRDSYRQDGTGYKDQHQGGLEGKSAAKEKEELLTSSCKT